MRTCTRCKASKPESEFYRDSRRPCGVKPSCKACCAAVQAERNYHAAWKERNPGRVIEVHRAYRDRHPEARGSGPRAEHREVQKAARSGELARPDKCQRCGVACAPHAHHPDYSRPLDVVWVCRKCHWKEHHLAGAPGEGVDRG